MSFATIFGALMLALVVFHLLAEQEVSGRCGIKRLALRIHHLLYYRPLTALAVAFVAFLLFSGAVRRLDGFTLIAIACGGMFLLSKQKGSPKKARLAKTRYHEDSADEPVAPPVRPVPRVIERPAAPVPTPPPVRHVVVSSNEYPEQNPSWFSFLLHTFAMFGLLAVGGGFFAISSRDVIVRGQEVAAGHSNHVHALPAVALASADAHHESTPAIDATGRIHYGPDDLHWVSLDPEQPLFTFHSDWRSEPHAAADDLRVQLTQYVREVIETKLGVDASFWSPPESWLRETFGEYDVESKPSGTGDILLTQMNTTIDVSPDLIRDIEKRFRTDQQSYRAVRLGKAYAGTVFILGGLAIFLRLGTGRKV